MSYDKYKRVLINLDNGTKLELNGVGTNNEPRNGDEAKKTFKRSTKFPYSFTSELSKDYEFTGSGANFLRSAYETKDIEAKVQMYEYWRNPRTDVFELKDIGDFDFSTYKSEKTHVSVAFNSGGLFSLIKSKKSDKFELDTLESIEGEEITPVIYNEFAASSRSLDLVSLLESTDEETEAFRMTYAADYRYGVLPIVADLVYESDDSVLSVLNDQFKVIGFSVLFGGSGIVQDSEYTAVRSQTFYYNSDRDKTINIESSFSFDAEILNKDDLEYSHLSYRLMRFTGGEEPVFNFDFIPINEVQSGDRFPEYDNFIQIANLNSIISNNSGSETIVYNTEIEVKKGDSFALVLFGGGNFEELIGNANLKIDLSNINFSLKIQELSTRNDLTRRFKCLLNRDIGSQLFKILTGRENGYYSEFFSKGDFSNTGSTTGKWLRGFSDDSYTTSFKDFANNSFSLYNMAYNVEIVDGQETLVHEPLQHFFRQEVVIVIDQQVSDVKRSVAIEFINSSIKSGYKKPDSDNLYEEVNGLNEFNTTNSYILPITRVTSEYNIQSPWRADSEGKELTIRKSITEFPTEDYRTDNTIFNLDLIDTPTGVYQERYWETDYEEEPKNVFDPSTATGFRLTPFRNMQRHFWFLKGSLTRLKDKFIRYTETSGNSELITKKVNEEEKAENGKFLINNIENERFEAKWIEFSFPLDFDLLSLVNGYTTVNCRRIPNKYFKVQFINEFNEKEYGYLFQLTPKGEGKWKLLKAV